MAHDQRRQQSNRNKDRTTSNSQPPPQTADTDDPKRIANRLAQRKFRRQRKDYIAHLENELALCRAGASDELTQRRQEVAKLHEEKAELRELLEHVANTIARVCRVDITICDQGSRPEVHAGPVTPSQTESHGGDDDQIAHVAEQRKNLAQRHAVVEEGRVDFDMEADVSTPNHNHHDHAQDDGQTIVVRLADEAPAVEADLDATTSQVDNTKSGLTQDTLAVVALQSPVQDQLPMDMSMTWDDGAYEPGEDCLVPLEDSETSANSIQASIKFPDKNQENLLLPVPSNKFMPHLDQILFAAPGVLRGICRSSGCPGRHGGSEKTQLMSIMLRRQVDEAVGSCLSSGGLESLESIQAMESTLVTSIVNAIVSMYSMATRMLGIHSMCLAGGSAWVVWQIAKTFWVLPRLADAGIVARAAELGFSSDLFGDSMPEWLRPTDIQKTFE
ncbi:hypothetical protein FMUND_10771 [Fusarium mundagurra]|uniref:BZIP domain-containing protein n=1 Tax=Fusarium mundagurra TaxID=1567541 RepID=A0A8H5Y9C3_9HYPO|nr:hypothetical protein FMUND_10771 [Fusarium mundagurra]